MSPMVNAISLSPKNQTAKKNGNENTPYKYDNADNIFFIRARPLTPFID